MEVEPPELPRSSQDEMANSHEGVNKGSILVVGVVGGISSLFFVTSLAGIFESRDSASGRILSGAMAAICGAVAVVSYMAWQVGGFQSLRKNGIPQFLRQLIANVSVALHHLGVFIVGLGIAAGALVAASVVSDEPMPGEAGVAWFALGALGAGLATQKITRRRSTIIRARIAQLQTEIGRAGREVQSASLRVSEASAMLEAVTRDLNREFQSLQHQSKINEDLADALHGRPELAAAIRAAQNKDRARSGLIQVALVVVSLVVGYLVNWTDDQVSRWLKVFFSQLS